MGVIAQEQLSKAQATSDAETDTLSGKSSISMRRETTLTRTMRNQYFCFLNAGR